LAAPATAFALENTSPVGRPLSQTREITSVDRFYRPELDALRFLAFLSVFLHHGLPSIEQRHFSGLVLGIVRLESVVKRAGGFGVCLFFVLSAYLITELLNRERTRAGRVDVVAFYIRRILRIWPLYFLFLLFAFTLGTVVHSYYIEPARIWSFALLAGNWYVAAVGCASSPIAPLWSISLEEQFYLAWPWIAKLGGRALMVGLSLMLFPVSWLVLVLLARNGAQANGAIWVNSLVQFQFFALGALLAIALKGLTPRFSRGTRCMFLAAGLLCWLLAAGAFGIKTDTPPPSAASLVFGYIFVAAGCAMLVVAFLGVSRWLSPKLVYLGKISYGLYVFHMLAIILVGRILVPPAMLESSALGTKLAHSLAFQLAALSVTLVLAVLSYRFLERPFLRMKQRFTVIKSRSA
jgi:peptidoglycan/LPS O-acetylase OafA/YrhL